MSDNFRDNFTTMETLIGLDTFDDLSNVARRRIINVIIHEDFTTTPVRDENDIAIATLNEPVMFSETIVPICLPEKSKYIYIHTYYFSIYNYFICH